MRQILLVLWFLVLSACGGVIPGPNPPDPPDPPKRDYHVIVTVLDGSSGQRVSVPKVQFNTSQPLTGNEYGVVDTRQVGGTYNVCARADLYVEQCETISVTRDIRRDIKIQKAQPPISRLRVEGRFFINDQGTARPVFASLLSLLAKPPPDRATAMDEIVGFGFTGFRVFAGALPWAGQTTQSAVDVLPTVLQEARTRRLYVEVTAVTGSSEGYDVEAHLQKIATIVGQHENAFLELANEPYHPTQAASVQDFDNLAAMGRRVVPSHVIWALGAPPYDELQPVDIWPAPKGPFITSHLDRSRDKWNQVRRVRELAGVSENTGLPVVNNEPIGAAEVSQPGRRESDPAFFMALGALGRMFEVLTIFHSEDGLMARTLGPNQAECPRAFIEGWQSIERQTKNRLSYRNAGWEGSDVPVQSFTNAVRVYAGITGDDGYVVVVGDEGVNVVWKNGYRVVAELARMPGVIVWKVQR